ncbi:hypothetical protein FJZ36_14740 [Candidatus Poribacteria bacterium]|nr:hypothetical protein [Candidatus Poribacteria bacterium]
MRLLVIAEFDIDKGNAAISDGSFGQMMQTYLGDVKPEMAFFALHNGNRALHMLVNVNSAAELPAIAEPLFLRCNANLTVHPAFLPDELGAAMPAIEAAVKKYMS